MYSNGKRERGASSSLETFSHAIGDVVLVRWSDERIYYAKIKTINRNRQTCQVMFEDNRRGTAEFDQIHAVDSAVEDWIACIVCKFGTSDSPNQIVLCDKCGVAFHQKCHFPNIADSALEPSAPWVCHFCKKGKPNPHLEPNEDKTPFAAENTKVIGRRRLPSNTSTNHSNRQNGLREGKPKGRARDEDDRESGSSSGESTRTDKPEVGERPTPTQSARALVVGKRRQAENRDSPSNSPEPPSKKRASPVPSASSARNIDEKGRKNSDMPTSHAPVMDSGKVGSYAKWKQDRSKTTQIEQFAKEEGHEMAQPTKKVVQATPSSQAVSDAPQSKIKAAHVIAQPQLCSVHKPAGQASAFAQNRLTVAAENMNQTAAQLKHQISGALPAHSKTHVNLGSHSKPQSDSCAPVRNIFSSVAIQASKNATSKVDRTLTSLAEQFNVHYFHLMRSLQTAHPYGVHIAGMRSSAKGKPYRHLYRTHEDTSQIEGKHERLHPLPPKDPRDSKVSSDSPLNGYMPSSQFVNKQTQTPAKQKSQKETKKYTCAGCGRHAQFVCSRCQNVWYCSRQCQERSYIYFCQNCTGQD